MIQFEKLREEVKINQMPGMFHLGRKDNMEKVCDIEVVMFDNISGSQENVEEVWLQLGPLPSSNLPSAWRIFLAEESDDGAKLHVDPETAQHAGRQRDQAYQGFQ